MITTDRNKEVIPITTKKSAIQRCTIKNLLTDTTTEEKIEFLNSFDFVLADCDGVIWSVFGDINDVGDAINIIKEHGKTLVYLSNNGTRSKESVLEKFKNLNIHNFTMNDMLEPGIITGQYLRQINFQGLIYTISSTEFRNVLQSNGFSVIYSPDKPVGQSLAHVWEQLKENSPVRAVVMDSDLNINYVKLLRAIRYLKDPNCLFIVCGTENEIPYLDDLIIIGNGPFRRIVEEYSKRQATVIGKPGIALKNIVMAKLKAQKPNRVLMIGDTLEQDIGFGVTCGFKTLLVLTGSTKLKDLQKELNPKEKPDYYLENIGDFVKLFKDIKKCKL